MTITNLMPEILCEAEEDYLELEFEAKELSVLCTPNHSFVTWRKNT